jgi:hypothetical protein
MLEIMHSAKLLVALDKTWVLNYGAPLPDSLVRAYPEVAFLQVRADCRSFELPSLKALHRLGSDLAGIGVDTHLLYMHTKGVSYRNIPEGIHRHRRMMMHHLVTKHQACYHMLLSREIDVVGTMFGSFPHMGPRRRQLYGNFFWTRANYVATIPASVWTEAGVDKYTAEQFILNHPHYRLWTMRQENDAVPERDIFPPAEVYQGRQDCALMNVCIESFHFNRGKSIKVLDLNPQFNPRQTPYIPRNSKGPLVNPYSSPQPSPNSSIASPT